MRLLFKKYNKEIRNVLLLVLFMLSAWLFFFGHKYQFIYNFGTSMEPTIADREWMVVQKRSNLADDWAPDRLDLVLIEDESTEELLTKRVIGLPGETIEIKKGQIYLNGSLFKGPFGKGKMSFFLVDENDEHLKYWNGPNSGEPVVQLVDSGKQTIPKGYVWVIGDNRTVSWFGALAMKDIKALVIF